MVPLLAALLSAAPPAAPVPPRLSIPFERYVLPNGLTVILHPDRSLPTVTVNLSFAVGSADEAKGRTGFAHLFEHLMFMGTNEVPNGEFDQIMEKAGGSNNAFTNNNFTVYFESGPSNLLETFLYLEADRLGHLPDAMTKAKVDLQRDVVKNERRQSYENRPYGVTELIIMDKLFPAAHPYHHPVIGSHADLTAASVDDVKAFFRRNYVPANASLVVTGDFDAAQARLLVEKYLGALPRVDAPLPPTIPPAELKASVKVVQPDDVQAERVVLSWLAPGRLQPGDAELELLSAALATGKSSRLVSSLVTEQQLAQSVEIEHEQLSGVSVFSIVATAQGTHTAAELEKAVDLELQRLQAEPIGAAELSRAVGLVQSSLLAQLEQGLSLAIALNEMQHRAGDPGELERSGLARYDAVTPTLLAEWAKRTIGRPRLSLTFVPKKKKEAKR